MLKIKHASLTYQGQKVFKDLNIEVATHEWVAILGKSGVGKTSLLRMVSGLAQQFPFFETEILGEISWQGQQDFANAFNYMAQQDGLMPWLSVFDNVLLPQRLRGDVLDVERAKLLLEQVGLLKEADQKPVTLSGGMRQRVALARTLMQDRPILLMDEPFSALDALTRLEMQKLLFDMIIARPQLVMMVTHDPWEALRLAERILVLSGSPAKFGYTVNLPKNQVVREITPDLLNIYNEILEALDE